MTYLMTLLDPLKAHLSYLGPLNMPLDPIGPFRSPVVNYCSSEDSSNVTVAPLGRP